MAQVEIVAESEESSGWSFEAQVLDDAGGLRRHHVLLSWADYNHWSRDGSDSPAQVVEAVIRFLAERDGAAALRQRFDASIVRRLHPDADKEIPGRIG